MIMIILLWILKAKFYYCFVVVLVLKMCAFNCVISIFYSLIYLCSFPGFCVDFNSQSYHEK